MNEMWNEDIDVKLQVKGLRIGGGMPKYNIDLPTLSIDYASSSIKGVLRKAARKVVNSIGGLGLDGVESEVFGNQNKEGKIQVSVRENIVEVNSTKFLVTEDKSGSHILKCLVCGEEIKYSEAKQHLKVCKRRIRSGIKIDSKFGSVKSGHLFSYDYIPVKTLKFSIKPILPLSDKEALLIYYSLNFLRYESLGGFGSRGFGLIEDVCVSDKFREYVVKRRDVS
ncbi:hypothetical protein DRP05_05970 [Archaeoglobales archaeon]|nr:MAG: hypothetical protein DRP05_05970 [Archaeoglobales archaeon]